MTLAFEQAHTPQLPDRGQGAEVRGSTWSVVGRWRHRDDAAEEALGQPVRIRTDHQLLPVLSRCSSDYQSQLDRHVSGTTIAGPYASFLRDFTIPVPSLDVQRMAAPRMGAVRDAIIDAPRRLQPLAELRRAETDLQVATAECQDE